MQGGAKVESWDDTGVSSKWSRNGARQIEGIEGIKQCRWNACFHFHEHLGRVIVKRTIKQGALIEKKEIQSDCQQLPRWEAVQ